MKYCVVLSSVAVATTIMKYCVVLPSVAVATTTNEILRCVAKR